MTKKKVLSHAEVSVKGGKARWKGVSKKQRSALALKGWETRRKNKPAV